MRLARRWLAPALCAAASGGLCIWFRIARPTEQAFDYLAAFCFVASTVVGALSLLAMTYAVSARWFVVLRRLCMSVIAPAWLAPILYLPLALGLRSIYPWAGSSLVSAESAQATQRAQVLGRAWMSPTPFLLRSAFYLLVWLAFAEVFRRAARAEERERNSWFLTHRTALSALALPVLGLSGSWAAFDWTMSAVPEWNMTSVGLYLLTGGFASALGVLAIVFHFARLHGSVPSEVGSAHSLALGRLLLAAVCLWAYIAVSQLIIAWVANLPKDAAFYVPRARGAWRYLAGVLVFGHFLVPFALLLSRAWKERSGFVAIIIPPRPHLR